MNSKKTSVHGQPSTPTSQDSAFIAQARAQLDDNIHDIDGDTRQQLRAIREQALLQSGKRSFFTGPRAAIALAIVSAFIVLIPINRLQTVSNEAQPLPEALQQIEDLDLLQSGETFEILSNIEMYQWMILEDPAAKS